MFQGHLHVWHCTKHSSQGIQPPYEVGESPKHLPDEGAKSQRLSDYLSGYLATFTQPLSSGVRTPTQVYLTRGSQLRQPTCQGWSCGLWFPFDVRAVPAQLNARNTYGCKCRRKPSGRVAGLRLCLVMPPMRTQSHWQGGVGYTPLCAQDRGETCAQWQNLSGVSKLRQTHQFTGADFPWGRARKREER